VDELMAIDHVMIQKSVNYYNVGSQLIMVRRVLLIPARSRLASSTIQFASDRRHNSLHL
jgi:hypothetical protein